MSGWLGIIALIITTVGGSFGVTYLNNRKELTALKLKMQAENDDKLAKKTAEYIEIIEKRLSVANQAFDDLYKKYQEALTELQIERMKSFSAVQELAIVKKEYNDLKDVHAAEKLRLETENARLREQCAKVLADYEVVLGRLAILEKGQAKIEGVIHPESVQPTHS